MIVVSDARKVIIKKTRKLSKTTQQTKQNKQTNKKTKQQINKQTKPMLSRAFPYALILHSTFVYVAPVVLLTWY